MTTFYAKGKLSVIYASGEIGNKYTSKCTAMRLCGVRPAVVGSKLSLYNVPDMALLVQQQMKRLH